MQKITSNVVDHIVETSEEKEFWTVVREHERPNFYFPEEGIGNRLNRAARVVYEERITPNSDGSFTVEGSEGHTYRVREHCSCPDSTYRKERPCYHEIAVTLYIEWQRRLRPVAPVVLGTLRAGTMPLPREDDDALGNGFPVDDETLPLPLPPVTVDERLALSTIHDSTALSTNHTPQEDRMADDDGYIPEPDTDDAPVAVMEPVTTPQVPEPVRVQIPAEYVMSIKGKRHVLYAGLVIMAQRSGLASLAADWTYNDAELSLAHAVATFTDGRRYEDSGDASPANVNKGIATHFRRVALTRAKARCLRDALGIQECSVEEMEDETPKRDVPEMTPKLSDQDLRKRIWAIVKERSGGLHEREAIEQWIQAQTGYVLHPDHYSAILNRLRGGA